MLLTFSQIAKLVIGMLFILCLLDMPSSYYEIMRYISFVGFTTLAYYSYLDDNKSDLLVFLILAIALQPFVRFRFNLWVWYAIDLLVGSYLILSALVSVKKKFALTRSNIEA